MSVGGPRIGLFESSRQVAIFGRCVGPQAERAVYVNPGALFFCAGANFFGGIECAAIHVACLDANDRALADSREFVGAHSALAIGFDYRYALFSEAC